MLTRKHVHTEIRHASRKQARDLGLNFVPIEYELNCLPVPNHALCVTSPLKTKLALRERLAVLELSKRSTYDDVQTRCYIAFNDYVSTAWGGSGGGWFSEKLYNMLALINELQQSVSQWAREWMREWQTACESITELLFEWEALSEWVSQLVSQ